MLSSGEGEGLSTQNDTCSGRLEGILGPQKAQGRHGVGGESTVSSRGAVAGAASCGQRAI